MANVEINLALQNGTDEYDYKRYTKGDSLKGSVVAIPDGEVDCKHFYVQLLWQTEGRGSQFTEMVAELDLYQGKLTAGMPRSYDFDFVLPDQPWSYDGHYINIVWKIRAQIDIAWASDPTAEVVFVLRPLSDNESF
jgi:hypothetical protein